MKKNKGFTLIELLAVIIILGIVLLIAVPGIIHLINDYKNKAYLSQIDLLELSARNYINGEGDTISWTSNRTLVTMDMMKQKGYLDKKIIDPRNKKELTCGDVLFKRMNGKTWSQVDMTCQRRNYAIDLDDSMIPIVYKNNKWVKADPTNKEKSWFNYDAQSWANIAITTPETRDTYKKNSVGSEILMDDILTMYTWIPRFKYRLWNVDGSVAPINNANMDGNYKISVELETVNAEKSYGNTNGQWLTHPAFTFGTEELEGFWVGKFINGYKGAISTNTAQNNETNANQVVIKPNVYSWRNISGKNMFDTTKNMTKPGNVFGLDVVHDSHLMKNIEWGAVAYLGYSKYGKAGNTNYSGAELEVRKNANSTFLTGCGATAQDQIGISTCEAYQTANGQAASTTGNITGIYDMSGRWQVLAGIMKDPSGNISVSGSEFDQERLNKLGTDGKYFDIYEYNNTYDDRTRGHLGDATIETGPIRGNSGSWYYDYAAFPFKKISWFTRGGGNVDGAICGLFEYGYSSGSSGATPNPEFNFRTVMI